MNARDLTRIIALSALLAQCTPHLAVAERMAQAQFSPEEIKWLDRPWEYRYLMYVTWYWKLEVSWAEKRMQEVKSDRSFQPWKPLFEPRSVLRIDQGISKLGDQISIIVIEFDKDGRVLNHSGGRTPLIGRVSRHQEILLTTSKGGETIEYPFANWFLGLGDISTHWAPGVCSTDATPSPFDSKRTSYLYGPKFDVTPASPTVGCREWAYQLYAPDRPYIDITSYVPKRLDPNGPGAYIEEIIGWARFGDHKPVIGLHRKTWYCLHDCPSGSEPGIIPDITAWARRNGWRPPKPPTRVPVFPDPPARSGIYP